MRPALHSRVAASALPDLYIKRLIKSRTLVAAFPFASLIFQSALLIKTNPCFINRDAETVTLCIFASVRQWMAERERFPGRHAFTLTVKDSGRLAWGHDLRSPITKATGLTAMKTRKIGLANYLAYGSGDFLGAGTTALTAAWLLYFYTTFCGLTPIEATFIFAMARVLDAVVSPLMGYLTDNFGSTWLGKRFGRRKFFILLGIPLVFSYSFMWVGEMSYWYYLVTYLIFDVVYTMILVPYETLVPEMTDDFKQKTKFSGARISMAQLSAILAAFLPGILLNHFGKDNAVSFFYASLVFATLCAIVLTLVWLFTWERPREEWTEAALRAEE